MICVMDRCPEDVRWYLTNVEVEESREVTRTGMQAGRQDLSLADRSNHQ
jgi:hypothetical protein